MGAVFSMFGGFYHWFTKLTKLRYSEFLGLLHFWTFFIGVNLTFFPMHYLGVAGMPRWIPDYPDAFYIFNLISSVGASISILSIGVFFFVIIEAFYNKPEKPLKKLAAFYNKPEKPLKNSININTLKSKREYLYLSDFYRNKPDQPLKIKKAPNNLFFKRGWLDAFYNKPDQPLPTSKKRETLIFWKRGWYGWEKVA